MERKILFTVEHTDGTYSIVYKVLKGTYKNPEGDIVHVFDYPVEHFNKDGGILWKMDY